MPGRRVLRPVIAALIFTLAAFDVAADAGEGSGWKLALKPLFGAPVWVEPPLEGLCFEGARGSLESVVDRRQTCQF